MDIFLEEHKKFLLLLLKHKVEFILIGGYAVIYYGYQRTTADMDIWLKPTNENRDKFINALIDHGISINGATSVSQMNFNEVQVMHIGEEPNKIDFLTKVQGLSFDEADSKKVSLPLKDKFIPILQYQHLIITKLLSGRPQDKADVDKLKNITRLKKT